MPTKQEQRKYAVRREADLLRVSWENLRFTKLNTAQACAETKQAIDDAWDAARK